MRATLRYRDFEEGRPIARERFVKGGEEDEIALVPKGA
jgi:hypothetical protein